MDWDSGQKWFFIGLVIAGSIAWGFVRIWWRRRKDYREIIKPLLAEHGFDLVRIDIPPMSDTGPFPKFDDPHAFRRSFAPMGTSEYTEYRVATFRDVAGREHTAWCRLHFQRYRIWDVAWAPPLDELQADQPADAGDTK